MPQRSPTSDVMRIVVGERGRVTMCMELVLRFGYGAIVPWVSRLPDRTLRAVAGPDMVLLSSPVEVRGENFKTVGEFTVAAGDTVPFALIYSPSHLPPPQRIDPQVALAATEDFWRDWTAKCQSSGRYHDAVIRSLITLKALTYGPTGGIVAAPTTSLPERIGGVRNWDYRFCWLRDATLTLLALMNAGYYDEAEAWREWLVRAVAGRPEQTQIMYGIAGERRLDEWQVPWLPGFRNSAPVRVGNGAYGQLQLDVFGEVMDALHAGPPRRPCLERHGLGGAGRAPAASGAGLADARPRHLGGAERAAALHLFQGDGLGGLRSRHQERCRLQARRPGRALAAGARQHPRGGVPARLRSGAKQLRAVL